MGPATAPHQMASHQTAPRRYVAFDGPRRIAAGAFADVGLAVKQAIDRGEAAEPVLIFDAVSSGTVEMDFRGSLDDVRARLDKLAPFYEPEAGKADEVEEPAKPKPGRPKLGVVGREVTLLPRHWDWLGSQPGGASVALRKLVEQARKDSEGADAKRRAVNACYTFMNAMAGNLPNFEEASRALFAGDRDRFDEMVDFWPADVRDHAHALADRAFEGGKR